MKASRLFVSSVIGLCCCAGVALAQNEKPAAPQPAKKPVSVTPGGATPAGGAKPAVKTPEPPAGTPAAGPSEAEMKAWMEFATPGEHHKQLAQFEGEWDAVSKMWMAPTAPPEVSSGQCSMKMEFEGRYLWTRYEGTMMGSPFKGAGIVGYNNMSKQLESTWIDNMGTGVMFMTGSCDAAGKVWTYKGECDDPMTKTRKMMKEVTKIVDANTHVMEFFEVAKDGKETKMMEITYTRKGTGAPKKPDASSK